MSTPENLSEQVLAAPSGAGAVRSLGETFTPDLQTGTGCYRIPLPLLPGPAGISPALALVYASTGGNGRAGLGWDLDLASIGRRTDKGLPTFDDARDRFTLQGDELVPQGGSCYRFRVERRFARIRRLTGSGRDAWVVTERDGTRTFYGDVPEARLSDGARRVTAWYVTRTQDVHGNEVLYTYERNPRTAEVCLVSVQWGGCYRLLVSSEPRPDPVVSARAGFPTRIDRRVSAFALEVRRSDTREFHTYWRSQLDYTVSRWTGRSLLSRVTATGIGADGAERTLPPLTFAYVDADLSRARWNEILGDRPGRSLESADVTLVRQAGSGLPDIFETRPTGHTLRVNVGGGRYQPARTVSAPALVALADAGTFLSDMDGDGYADLVVDGGRRVYAARPTAGGWGGTYRVAQAPSVDLDAPDVRLADLTGNGLPDALRSGVSGWTFFENLGEGRWAPPVGILQAPPIRLDDPRVHLVDVDGDGLADLAYVDGAGVTVWPSLGRGRFGAPYRMAGRLRFGQELDPHDVRFVDLTGSGQADLLYVRDGVAQVAFNHAGVGFAALAEMGRSPLSSHGFVEVADMLGTGVDGLLYTDQGGAWRFRELFTSGPLDLLAVVDNGIGGTTTITYGTSAGHWVRDLAAGRPWRTQMPITVRVVDRVTTRDAVTGAELEVSYQYAHGVYDGEEREFRGFARVTQLDREAPADDPDPIAQARVVRWFHTGAALDLRDEWCAVPGAPLEDEIPNHAWARRSMRGLMRREETYALDGERRPYLVAETAWRTFAVGRSSTRLHSAWAPLAIRSRTTILERTTEARQSEVLTTYDLHADPAGYGLPIEVREIGHGRRGTFATDHERQQTETLARVTRTTYVHLDGPETDAVTGPYVPCYVVGKPSVEERVGVTGAGEELLARTRSFYDGEDYRGLGYPGTGTTPGVTHGRLSARLELAFTAASFAGAYPAESGAAVARDAHGRYLLDGDDYYRHAVRMAWRANGLAAGSLDPNGHETTAAYDAAFELFPVRLTDPLGHPTTIERGMLPFQIAAMVDANGNRTELTYDPTTLPESRSVMGKFVGGAWQGDPPDHPTEAYEYDLDASPIRITTKTRQVRLGATLDVHRFLDGLGRVVQERHTAEPDPGAPSTPRFRVTGWQIYNHKGLIVRTYQPVFGSTPEYGPGDTTTTAVATRYDPLGRASRVTYADGTFTTATCHPWRHTLADRNDNAGHITSDDPLYGSVVATFAPHLGTPTHVFLDALGRLFATAEDAGAEVHVTRKVFDLRDQVIAVWDGRGLAAATWRFAHDYVARPVSVDHATALGVRLSLADAAGNLIWSRDARGVEVTRTFDALCRPLAELSTSGASVTRRRQWGYVTYDEAAPEFASLQARNLFVRVEEERDADGLRVFEYEHRGLVTRVSHRFWSQEDSAGRPWDDPASELWTAGASWDPEIPAGDRDTLTSYLRLPELTDPATLDIEAAYDAASHPTQARYPAGLSTRTTYGAAGLLATIDVDRGAGAGYETVVEAAAYNARGQLTGLTHGNGVHTTREYSADLERLTRIFTRALAPAATRFQDLAFTYDPAGNPVIIRDDLTASSFSHNRIIPNTRTFAYDARYRLIEATGRQHATVRRKDDSHVLVTSPDPNDYAPYTIRYAYDAAGNFVRDGEYTGGSLHYKADRPDLFNGDETEAGSFTDPALGNFRYDENGNTLHTPRHAALAYTHDNQVRYVDLSGGGEVRYFRHADQRVLRLVRKNGVRALAVYIGPFEYHTRQGASAYTKVVLHVQGQGRHAQAERLLAGVDPDSLPLFFDHADHLRSGHVQTTADGDLLGQEEYFPHGRASDRRDARNRYRFIGVERDEDTGLCMTGPRTYDPVSARFLQGDPVAPGHVEVTPFAYTNATPTRRVDPSGYSGKVDDTFTDFDVSEPTSATPDVARPVFEPEVNTTAVRKSVVPEGFTMSKADMDHYIEAVYDVTYNPDTETGRRHLEDFGKSEGSARVIGKSNARYYKKAEIIYEWASETGMRQVADAAAREMRGIEITTRAAAVAAAGGSAIARVGLQAAAEGGLELAATLLAEMAAPGVGGAIVGAGSTGAAIKGAGWRVAVWMLPFQEIRDGANAVPKKPPPNPEDISSDQ
jgi:RHS repeat-associated protein